MIDLAVDALAAYRLTRLVVEDRIADRPRDALTTRSVFADDLLSCRWCSGVWVSAVVVAARVTCPRVWAPVGRALALSAVAGLLAGLE